MSDNIQHLDLDSDDFLDAPRALREHVKKLQKAYDSAVSERNDFRSKLNSQALTGVLSTQGFKNPKRVEKDLLADGVDPLDQSAVDGWLAEFGDDYAKGASRTEAETPVVPDEERLAHQQLQVGSEFKSPADMSRYEAALAELPKDATPEQFVELAQKHGL